MTLLSQRLGLNWGGSRSGPRQEVVKLKDPEVREPFNITLRDRYSILQDEPAITIDQFHQVMNAAAAETIGYKRSTKTEWLSKDTWSMIEERKRLKGHLLDAGSPRLKERAATVQRERKRRSQLEEIYKIINGKKLLDRMVNVPRCWKQKVRKLPTYCSASGLKVTPQMTGRNESSLSYPKKMTKGDLLYQQDLQPHHFTASFFYIIEAVESTLRRRPVLEKREHTQTTYLYYGKYVIY